MTRDEEIKQAAEETLRREGYHPAVHEFMDGAKWADAHPINPWHKVSEELPKMKHFTADGDFSDLCVCINESGEHKILGLCYDGDDTYWAYGYDGEGLYDEEMDGGEIVKWMELPKED